MYPVLVFVHLATTSSVEIPSPSLESRLHYFVEGHHCTCRSTVIVQYPPPSLKPHSPTSSPHCRSKIVSKADSFLSILFLHQGQHKNKEEEKAPSFHVFQPSNTCRTTQLGLVPNLGQVRSIPT